MDKKIKEAIAWATKHAEAVPEQYRIVSYKELLHYRLILLTKSKATSITSPQSANSKTKTDDVDAIKQDWISVNSSEVPPSHIVRDKGSESQKVAWAVIGLTESGELATTKTVRDYIQTNLAISPPNRQNTNRAFRTLFPKHLSRSKIKGGAYSYLPKPGIQQEFSALLKNEA